MNEPKFSGLLVISEPSFVVDDNGVGWWINPGWQSIKRATGSPLKPIPYDELAKQVAEKMKR